MKVNNKGIFVMKKIHLFILITLSILLLFGCSKKKDENQNSNTITQKVPTKKVVKSTPTPIPSRRNLPKPGANFVSEDMYKNAILGEGNLARLAAVMRKAERGEDITIGVIGGSITESTKDSNSDNSYAYRFYDWWVKAFPKTKVSYVNAGIGDITSYIGVHWIGQDLLTKSPDVVLIDFSVNDTNSKFYQETYEDLIRKILISENNPAVLLFFRTMEDGTSAQAYQLPIGYWYDLPRISYRQAILNEIEKGTFTWKDIASDNIHPNDKGQAIMGEMLWKYLNQVYAKLDSITEAVTPLTKKPFGKATYMDAVILDNTTITPSSLGSFANASVSDQFKNDWTTSTGEEEIEFETEAKNIGIMFYKTTDGLSGKYDVYVDGKFKRTLNADFTGGLSNYAEAVEVYHSKEKKTHKIEIRKSEDSIGTVFTILGLLIS